MPKDTKSAGSSLDRTVTVFGFSDYTTPEQLHDMLRETCGEISDISMWTSGTGRRHASVTFLDKDDAAKARSTFPGPERVNTRSQPGDMTKRLFLSGNVTFNTHGRAGLVKMFDFAPRAVSKCIQDKSPTGSTTDAKTAFESKITKAGQIKDEKCEEREQRWYQFESDVLKRREEAKVVESERRRMNERWKQRQVEDEKRQERELRWIQTESDTFKIHGADGGDKKAESERSACADGDELALQAELAAVKNTAILDEIHTRQLKEELREAQEVLALLEQEFKASQINNIQTRVREMAETSRVQELEVTLEERNISLVEKRTAATQATKTSERLKARRETLKADLEKQVSAERKLQNDLAAHELGDGTVEDMLHREDERTRQAIKRAQDGVNRTKRHELEYQLLEAEINSDSSLVQELMQLFLLIDSKPEMLEMLPAEAKDDHGRKRRASDMAV